MSERRYNDAEVAEIFERATEASTAGARHEGSGDGMTLAQLQDIAREVGIPAESMALAVQAVERGNPPPPRTVLGLPLGVERTVELNRRLTDDEWERVVVLLRETFNARGTMSGQGSLRQWTNGNLQALLEPTATGQRIRLRTMKGSAMGQLFGGFTMMGISAVGLAAMMVQGATGDTGAVVAVATLGAVGAGMLGSSVMTLPGWARTRQRQMDDIAAALLRDITPALPASNE